MSNLVPAIGYNRKDLWQPGRFYLTGLFSFVSQSRSDKVPLIHLGELIIITLFVSLMSTGGYWFLIICGTLFATFNPSTLYCIAHFSNELNCSVPGSKIYGCWQAVELRLVHSSIRAGFDHFIQILYILQMSELQSDKAVRFNGPAHPQSFTVDANTRADQGECSADRCRGVWTLVLRTDPIIRGLGGSLPICVVAAKWSTANNMTP